MSIYVKKNNEFEQALPVSRDCPHCGRHARLEPVATPSFAELTRAKPRHVGVCFRCSACNEPRFARVAVRAFGAERVELSGNLVEVERAKERFQFNYLPAPVQSLFREALNCYTADCHNAFASMCRRTIRAAQKQSPGNDRTRLYDLFRDVVTLCGIDGTTAARLAAALFASDGDEPELDAEHSAVLIEVVKDMLYQRYVRNAKLKAAIRMRRHFAADERPRNVTPIQGRRAV